jgi:hypothetical protein
MALSGYGRIAVTPDTVLVVAPVQADIQFYVILAIYFPGLPRQQENLAITAQTGRFMRSAPLKPVDYPLLC